MSERPFQHRIGLQQRFVDNRAILVERGLVQGAWVGKQKQSSIELSGG